jgi:hypothetical protein
MSQTTEAPAGPLTFSADVQAIGIGPVPAVTTAPARKHPLDWKALQRALVFTKMVYRKPAAEGTRAATGMTKAERPIPSAEQIVSVAKAAVAPRTFVNPAPHLPPDPSRRHSDAFGETDERLLPWSND